LQIPSHLRDSANTLLKRALAMHSLSMELVKTQDRPSKEQVDLALNDQCHVRDLLEKRKFVYEERERRGRCAYAAQEASHGPRGRIRKNLVLSLVKRIPVNQGTFNEQSYLKISQFDALCFSALVSSPQAGALRLWI